MPLPSAQNQTFFMLVLSALAKQPLCVERSRVYGDRHTPMVGYGVSSQVDSCHSLCLDHIYNANGAILFTHTRFCRWVLN